MRTQDELRLACATADYLARALPAHMLWTHFPAGEARSKATGAGGVNYFCAGEKYRLMVWRGAGN